MRGAIRFVIYLLIGIAGAQTIGYGLLEALLWPVFAPIALWSRIRNRRK